MFATDEIINIQAFIRHCLIVDPREDFYTPYSLSSW